MGCVDAELLSSVLLLPADMVIEAVYPSKTLLTVQVVCRLQSAACPLCQQSSERIHGSYGRTVADVSCGGRRVTLALTVRKLLEKSIVLSVPMETNGQRSYLPSKRQTCPSVSFT